MPPRRYIRVLSAFIHVAIVSTLIGAQLFSTGPLPTPHTVLAFSHPLPIRVVDIPLPPPSRGSAPAPADTSANLAPIEAPPDVAPETGLENLPSVRASTDMPSVEAGIPGGMDLPGNGLRVEPPPPPPPPVAQPPIRLRSGMEPPRKTLNVLPKYPTNAQLARIEGTVVLDAVIDATGRVTDVRVIRSIRLLDQAAIDAVRAWRFTPTLLNGNPVPILLTVTVQFRLGPS